MRAVLFSIFAIAFFSGCVLQSRFVGTLETDPPKGYNPNGCGICFTSDDGSFKCALMDYPPELKGDLNRYLGRKVAIYGKKHEGAVNTMCPAQIDVERIELIE